MDGTWKTACFSAIFALHFSQVLTVFFVLRSKKNGKHFHFFYFSAAFFNFFKFFFDFVNRFALFHRLKYIERLIAEVIRTIFFLFWSKDLANHVGLSLNFRCRRYQLCFRHR